MPTPSSKSPKSQSPSMRRDFLVFQLEETFCGVGALIGLVGPAFLGKYLVDVYLPSFGAYWYGWTGCLLLIASALFLAVCSGAGLVLGWWLWLCLFAKRLAVTKEEIY